MNHIFAAAYLHALSLSQKNQLQNFLCQWASQTRHGRCGSAYQLKNILLICIFKNGHFLHLLLLSMSKWRVGMRIYLLVFKLLTLKGTPKESAFFPEMRTLPAGLHSCSHTWYCARLWSTVILYYSSFTYIFFFPLFKTSSYWLILSFHVFPYIIWLLTL